MRRTSTVTILAAMIALFLLCAKASAFVQPQLGSFLERDPIGYSDGLNTYQYEQMMPGDRLDSSGLACQCQDVQISFQPGDNQPKWDTYPYKNATRVGFKIVAKFKVTGNPKDCSFYQDESGTISAGGDVFPKSSLEGRPDNQILPENWPDNNHPGNTDSLGTDLLLNKAGAGTMSLNNFTVQLRCVDSNGCASTSPKWTINGSVTVNKQQVNNGTITSSTINASSSAN